MLQVLFCRGTERLAGLKIAREHLWEDQKTYKVVVLDFAELLKLIDPALSLREAICSAFLLYIRQQFTRAGLEPAAHHDLFRALCSRIEKEPSCNVVLLVKNNEAVQERFVLDQEHFELCCRLQNSFYKLTEECNDNFRYVLVTGCTHYGTDRYPPCLFRQSPL